MVAITDDAVAQFTTAWIAAHDINNDETRTRSGLMEVLSDVHLLREQGVRVIGEDQCCELGCDGGACESCPCCCAGWCVNGRDGLPDDPEDYRIWLEEAKDHNPIAARLAEQSS